MGGSRPPKMRREPQLGSAPTTKTRIFLAGSNFATTCRLALRCDDEAVDLNSVAQQRRAQYEQQPEYIDREGRRRIAQELLSWRRGGGFSALGYYRSDIDRTVANLDIGASERWSTMNPVCCSAPEFPTSSGSWICGATSRYVCSTTANGMPAGASNCI